MLTNPPGDTAAYGWDGIAPMTREEYEKADEAVRVCRKLSLMFGGTKAPEELLNKVRTVIREATAPKPSIPHQEVNRIENMMRIVNDVALSTGARFVALESRKGNGSTSYVAWKEKEKAR